MAYTDLTLPEFIRAYSTEEACLQAIFEARWPRGFICPRCGHNDGNRISTRRSIQCCVCRRQTSITSQTIYHKSRTPLTTWFLMIYQVAQDKGGTSALRLANQLGMHYSTVWHIVHKIREAMVGREENLTLAGYIQMDEAFFGGRFKNKVGEPCRPPTFNKVTVMVMVESEGRQAGNLVMKVIPDDRINTLDAVIRDKIESEPPGQLFRADGLGRHHVVMNHGHHVKAGHIPAAEQDKELKCVNLAISLAKRFFKGTYHHFCKEHMQRYLDEFCYRWNRRHLWGQLASHLIAACTLHTPMYYAAIPIQRATAA